jgi:hypothetical protein
VSGKIPDMGDTPKHTDSPRLGGTVLRELSNRYRRIETVRHWEETLPEVLDRSVSIHKAARLVIEAELDEGFSLGHIMKMIKLTRDFEDASPDAWLEHQLVGHLLQLRMYRSALNDYAPAANDYREIGRIAEINRLLKQVNVLLSGAND